MAKQTNNSPWAPLAIGFFLGVLAVGTALLVWNHDRKPPPMYLAAPSAQNSSSPATAPVMDSTALLSLGSTAQAGFEPTVARIASQFVCSCGSCGERRLDVCSCDTAQQERSFLQDQLRSGRSEAEAAKALNEKTAGSNRGRRDRMAN